MFNFRWLWKVFYPLLLMAVGGCIAVALVFFVDRWFLSGSSFDILNKDLSMEGVSFSGSNSKNELYKVKANTLKLENNNQKTTNVLLLEDVAITWESNEYGEVHILSDKARYATDKNELKLIDNVKIFGNNIGTVESKELLFNTKTGKIYGDETINYIEDNVNIQSESLDYNPDEGVVKSTGKTRIEIIIDDI